MHIKLIDLMVRELRQWSIFIAYFCVNVPCVLVNNVYSLLGVESHTYIYFYTLPWVYVLFRSGLWSATCCLWVCMCAVLDLWAVEIKYPDILMYLFLPEILLFVAWYYLYLWYLVDNGSEWLCICVLLLCLLYIASSFVPFENFASYQDVYFRFL